VVFSHSRRRVSQDFEWRDSSEFSSTADAALSKSRIARKQTGNKRKQKKPAMPDFPFQMPDGKMTAPNQFLCSYMRSRATGLIKTTLSDKAYNYT
jgi:hypothetical protein